MAAMIIDLTLDSQSPSPVPVRSAASPEIFFISDDDGEPLRRPAARRRHAAAASRARPSSVISGERENSRDRPRERHIEHSKSQRRSYSSSEASTLPENPDTYASNLLTIKRAASVTAAQEESARMRIAASRQKLTSSETPTSNRESLSHQGASSDARTRESGSPRPRKGSSTHSSSANTTCNPAKPGVSSTTRTDLPKKTAPAPPMSDRAEAGGQLGNRTQTMTTTSSRDASSPPPGVAKHRQSDAQTTPTSGERGRKDLPTTGSVANKQRNRGMGASVSTEQAEAIAKPRGLPDVIRTTPSPSMVIPTRQPARKAEAAQWPRDWSNPEPAREPKRSIDKKKEKNSKQRTSRSPKKSISNNNISDARQENNGVREAGQHAASNRVNSLQDPGSISIETLPSLDTEMPQSGDDGPLSVARVEEILMNHIADLREDHACLVKSKLPRSRRCFERDIHVTSTGSSFIPNAEDPRIPAGFLQEVSPFANMRGISISTTVKSDTADDFMDITQESLQAPTNPHVHTQKGLRSYLSIPVTKYKSTAVQVPPYTDYVSLRDNILTENNKKLLYWPYFAEEENEEKLGRTGLWEELDERFHMVNEYRPRRLLQAEQCRVHGSYADDFLKELGIDWTHVLFWLLAQENDITEIEPACKASGTKDSSDLSLLLERAPHCEEEFDRNHKKWIKVLSTLPKPSAAQLTLAAFACSAFLKLCNISLWHIARQGDVAQAVLSAHAQQSQIEPAKEPEVTYRDRACRVCTLHNCPYHGEIREDPNSEADGSDIDARSVASTRRRESSCDSVFGSSARERHHTEDGTEDSSSDSESDIINFKKHINAVPRKHKEDAIVNGNGTAHQPKVSVNYWLSKTETYMLHKRRPFYPCSHEGTCEDVRCRCFRERIACEKTCACPPNCKRRFRGCSCAKDPKVRVCAKNSKCECVQLNRECDADLCGTCGAAEVLDPVNRYNEDIVKDKCVNVHIQRNLPKRTILGHSEVQGFGLYAGEKIKAGSYLGEYKGEVITRGEAERRGAIYQHLKTNYLFSLNKEQEVDSTRAGNKFRFINNSCDDKIINCKPYIMLCNSVTRIGMYAERDLKVGEELFFNYGYPKAVTKGFWEKGQGPNGKRKPGSAQLVTVKSKQGKATALTGGANMLKKLPKESASKMKVQKSVTSTSRGRSSSRPLRSPSKPRKTSTKAPRPLEDRRAQTSAARAALLKRHEEKMKAKSGGSTEKSLESTSQGRARKRRRLASPTLRKRTLEQTFELLANGHDGSNSDDEDDDKIVRPAGRRRNGGTVPKASKFTEDISEIPETSEVEPSEDEADDEELTPEDFEPDEDHIIDLQESEESEFEAASEEEERGRERDSRLRPIRAHSEDRRATQRRELRNRQALVSNVRTRSQSRSRKRKRDYEATETV